MQVPTRARAGMAPRQSLYSRAVQKCRVLLRAVGLSLVARIKEEEPRKTLIYRSARAALSHSAIHLLPSCISIIVIVINFQGYFIGGELQGRHDTDNLKLGFLQFSAKLQVDSSNLSSNPDTKAAPDPTARSNACSRSCSLFQVCPRSSFTSFVPN